MKELVRQAFLRFPELWDLVPSSSNIYKEQHSTYTLRNAIVYGPQALVFDPLGVLHPGPTASQAMLRPTAFSHKFTRKKHDLRIPSAYYAGGACANNHWHFLLDVIPAILAHSAQLPILVNRDYHEAAHRLVPYFGIERTRLFSVSAATMIDSLTITPYLHQTHEQRIQTLADAYLGDVSPSPTQAKKIYISRLNAKRRHVLNEDEVTANLVMSGFRVIYLEHESFEDQIRIFANAETIVMPHGASGANFFMCKPGTRVIELMPAVGWSNNTIHMARCKQLRYHALECRNRLHDMIVPLDELMHFLDR